MTRCVLCIGLFAAAGCATSNPNVQIGVGLTVPVANRDVLTQAGLDRAGNVVEQQALDASPQLVVEIHKTFDLGEAEVGPMAGVVIPKVRIGESTEDPMRKDQPLGFGLGGVQTFRLGADKKRMIHVGFLWELITMDHIPAQWQAGKQAPDNRLGLPIPPSIVSGLVSRGLIVVTVSGVLQ
jgi:hypothetical protein